MKFIPVVSSLQSAAWLHQVSSILRIFVLVLLLAGNGDPRHGRVSALDPETLNIALDSSALNQLIDSLRDEFFPELANFVNTATDDISSTSIEGTCCGIGDIGVKSTARIYGFSLGAVNQNDINVVARDTGANTNSVRLGISANNVGLAANVETGVGAAFLVPLACFIGASASVSIPNVEFLFDINISPDSGGQVVKLELAELNLPFVNVFLFPQIDNICSVVSAFLSITFTALSFALSQLLLPILRGVFAGFINEQLSTAFNLGELVPGIAIGNGTDFQPELGFPRVQSRAGVFEFGLSTKFVSTLTEPEYRAGNSYITEIPSNILLPGAIATPPAVFSAHIGCVCDGSVGLFGCVRA